MSFVSRQYVSSSSIRCITGYAICHGGSGRSCVGTAGECAGELTLKSNTLSLYVIAGAMSFGLSLVMLTFSWRQPGRHLLSGMAMTMAMLAAALVVAGFGPRLPDWTTVLGTNLLLLAAGAILHSRLTAFCAQREARFDRVGWTLAALTAPPFWYWGLIEPDGQYRAAVFSFAAAAINGRTAWVIVRSAYQQRRNYVIQALALLFSLFSIWMAARGVSSLVADSPAVGARGDNPTSWLTVFWYIILVTLMSGCVIWLETGQSADRRRFSARLGAFLGFVNYFRDRLHLLWAAVLILLLGILGEAAVLYQKTDEAEEARLMRSTEVTNDAFVQHSLQLINGVDTLLHSVRSFYLRTQSIAVSPPPITTTFLPAALSSPLSKAGTLSPSERRFEAVRKSSALTRPPTPDPGPPKARDLYTPVASRIAS